MLGVSIVTRGLAASAASTVAGAVAAGAPGGVAATPARRAGKPSASRSAALRGAGGARGLAWFGLHLGLMLALIERTGVEILPGGHHQDRQRDREKEVSRVLGFHVRASLSFVPLGRSASATVRFAAPRGAKGGADIIDERGETAAQRLAPGHQHVIVIALRLKGRRGAQRLFQPPADAIAHDRVADGFGHCQPHTRARRGFVPVSSRRRDCSVKVATDRRRPRETRWILGASGQAARTFAGGARAAVLMQGVKAPFRGVFIDTRTAEQRPKPANQSGGELLAPAGAARREHLAAADRRRAGAKAMAALAHELAGLIGPLHGSVSEFQSSAKKIGRRPALNAQTPTRRDGRCNQAASRKNERGALRAAARPGLCRAGAGKSIAREARSGANPAAPARQAWPKRSVGRKSAAMPLGSVRSRAGGRKSPRFPRTLLEFPALNR